MSGRRYVCGWCPTPLPDDWREWYHHHLVKHGGGGYSIREYPALSEAEEMAALTEADDAR